MAEPATSTEPGTDSATASGGATTGHTQSKDGAGLRSLARGGVGGLLAAVVGGVGGLAFLTVAAHGFSRSDVGTVFTLTSLFLIAVATVELGTQIGLVRYIAIYLGRGDRERAAAAVQTVVAPVIVLGVVVGAVLAVLGPILATSLGGGADVRSGIVLLSLFVPIAVTSDLLLACTRGMGTVRPTMTVDSLARQGLQPVLALVVVLTTDRFFWLVAAWVVPYLLSALVGAAFLRGLARRNGIDLLHLPSREVLREVGRESWVFNGPRSITQVAQMAIRRADVPIVAALAGPAAAAVYTAASRFVSVGQLGIKGIQQMVGPQMARMLGEGRAQAAAEIMRTATTWSVVIAWPVYLGCIAVPETVLSLFGKGYGDGAMVVVILAAAMLVGTGAGPLDIALLMSGRSAQSLFNNMAALLTNLALNLALVPIMGINGAALAWAAAILVSNALPAWQIRTVLDTRPFAGGTSTAAMLAFACFGVLPLLGWALGLSTDVRLVLLAVGVPFYAVALWSVRRTLLLTELISAFTRRRNRRSRSLGTTAA